MNEDPQQPEQNEARNPGGKQPFEPPRLHVYGDIAALTRTVGRYGELDGGMGNMKGTRP